MSRSAGMNLLLLTVLVVALAASCFAADETVCSVTTTGTDPFHHVMAGHISDLDRGVDQDLCQASLLLVEACDTAGFFESFTIHTRADCGEFAVRGEDEFCPIIESSVTPGTPGTYVLGFLEVEAPEEQFSESGELDYDSISLADSVKIVDSLEEGDVTFTFDAPVYPVILETDSLLGEVPVKRGEPEIPGFIFIGGIFPDPSAEGSAAILSEAVFGFETTSLGRDAHAHSDDTPSWKGVFLQYLDVMQERSLQRKRGIPEFGEIEHSLAISLPCEVVTFLLAEFGIGPERDVKAHLMENFRAALLEWTEDAAHESEVRGESVGGVSFSGDFGHAYEFKLPGGDVAVTDLQFSFPADGRIAQAFNGALTFLRDFLLHIELESTDEVTLDEFTHSGHVTLSNLQNSSSPAKRAVGSSFVVSVHATCDGLAMVCLRGICTSVNIINCLSRSVV